MDALPKKLLQRVNVITPNEHEARLITGKKDLHDCGRWLQQAGCEKVVITMGSRGVWMFEGRQNEIVPLPFKVKPVDTVGAGDCFTAWLSVGIAEGLSFFRAVQRAMVAAAICITRPGAQNSMPSRREVERIHSKNV